MVRPIPWVPPDIFRAVLMRDPCTYCGGPAAGLDHIIPRSAGGTDGFVNRAPACSVCDQAKAATPLLLFLLSPVRADRMVTR